MPDVWVGGCRTPSEKGNWKLVVFTQKAREARDQEEKLDHGGWQMTDVVGVVVSGQIERKQSQRARFGFLCFGVGFLAGDWGVLVSDWCALVPDWAFGFGSF